MNLQPSEEARLLVFQAAELARRHRERGLKLSGPEATAIAADEMHLAARAGGSFDDVVAAGKTSVAPEDLLDGVAELISEIRVEVLMEDGTRLVVLRGLGADGQQEQNSIELAEGGITINAGMESLELDVSNDSDHVVRVSSHFPFDRVNPRLSFDRAAAEGTRLDIPAGDTVRFAPGEHKRVRLVRLRADRGHA
jgi:urease subunit gamma/beta